MIDKDLIKQWANHPMLLNESSLDLYKDHPQLNRIVREIQKYVDENGYVFALWKEFEDKPIAESNDLDEIYDVLNGLINDYLYDYDENIDSSDLSYDDYDDDGYNYKVTKNRNDIVGSEEERIDDEIRSSILELYKHKDYLNPFDEGPTFMHSDILNVLISIEPNYE